MRSVHPFLGFLLSLLLVLSLGACESEGPAEEAGERVDEAAESAGDTIEEAGEEVQR